MPIYQYSCPGCRHDFEYLSRDGEQAKACPECGATRIEKQFASFSVSVSSPSPSCGMGGDAGGCPGAGGPGCSRFN